ncbi:putative CCR4-NOT transcription complex subunit 1 protein [Naja naja]|nr:putative CCR4-NOT transcription complex subunit 1 protein [Naja naja]
MKMHQQGILKTDDLITRFFRLCTEMCVEISYRAQAEQQHNPAANPTMIRAKCYHNLDAFVRLIALLVKHSGEATNTVTKINLLNKGTLRVLLVLLHDFPEFLCDYHYGFCDVIPPNCIQLRNLILSAFPRNMRLPDPFTPNLKVDMLSEINIAPRILTNFTGVMPPQFKKDLDSYLKTRSPVTFLSDLRSNLQVSNEPGNRYNIQLINALVLYVGTQAIAHIHNKGSTPSMSTITHSAHMDIFQNLAVDLDTEGRYLFLNAIANQLRYPNSHTHYFSCTMLYLFAEANTEAIQEQITRVLLERLIVNRPHPWGLLITFIELIKNPAFKFWNHEFVHCAPEIEKLFQSVAQCCMGQKQAQQVMEGTGAS